MVPKYLNEIIEELGCDNTQAILARDIALWWIRKGKPYNKGLQFKRAAIKRLLVFQPTIISNGNIFFKDIPHAPKFPWECWVDIDWKNKRFGSKKT